MLTKFKKSFTIALAVVMCLSTVCASAASWRIKDYDTDVQWLPNPVVEIVYEEVDDFGRFTGRMANISAGEWKEQPNNNYYGAYGVTFIPATEMKAAGLKPYAQVEFKNPWFDIYYPNNEYANVYADGKNLGVYHSTSRNGLMNLVEYKDVDYMWEVAAPFQIYSVKKAKLMINGAVQWFGTPAFNYPTKYTGRNADVKVNKYAYGFGAYEITEAGKVTLVPAKLAGYVDAGYANVDLSPVAGAAPARQVLNIRYADIKIPRTYDYALVGPAFDEVGNATPYAKTVVASKYEGNPADFGVNPLISTVVDRDGNETLCDITWTAGGYEFESPHNIYEYLTVDGVVMNGAYIGKIGNVDYWLPCISAYTGAVANVH